MIIFSRSWRHGVPQDGASFWPWCCSGDGDCSGATSRGLAGSWRSHLLGHGRPQLHKDGHQISTKRNLVSSVAR